MSPDGDGPIAADFVIRNAWIVTMDAARQIWRDGALAVAGDRIVAVGPTAQVMAQVTARDVIDGSRFVLTPGLVNCHVHITGEPITRGYVPDDTDWRTNVFDWLIPTYLAQTPAEEQLAATLASVEMLKNGVTTFIEAGTILDLPAVMEAVDAVGIRGRLGQWIQDRAFAPTDDQAALTRDAIARLESQLDRWPVADDKRLAAWGCLVGHNTATDDLWRAATTMVRERGVGITAHMSADPADPDYYLATTGKRALLHLEELGALGDHLSLTHMIHLDDAEVAAVARSGMLVTHCPLTAMKGGYGVTSHGKFPEMQAAGVPIQLGTDGNNNGNIADLMRAMYLLAGLFKDARRDGDLFPAHAVLECATLHGAAAAGLAGTVGALVPGMKADFVAHDRNRPEWTPLLNVINQLVWSADGRGVHSVWVDGQRLVDNYRMTNVDEEALYAQIQDAAPGLIARAGKTIPCAWPVA
ncbi:amidohydrolase family protein [Novosphingobium capsulatum]|uniref:amidohydrolase family protein n=1 Tax=Novosphingobium capsulatum TaxID=13688 RepID=UPI000789149B|nr:amidohydrolase family protein [Novosphingobium capsulatum]WQD94591.1 amidohydrolase family protein [Novosphingobium capsulatum]